MRKALSVLVLCFASAGCAGGLLGEAGYIFVESVGEEYLEYVEKDADLSDAEKALRKAHVERFRKAVEEARK